MDRGDSPGDPGTGDIVSGDPASLARYRDTRWSQVWRHIRTWNEPWTWEMVCALVGVPLAMANEWADGIRAKPGAGTFDHHQLARLNKALELTNGRTSRRYWLNDRGERFVRLKPGEPIRLIPYREPEAVDILPEPIPFRKR